MRSVGRFWFHGWRGAPATDVAALADLVSRFSQQLAAAARYVAEVDLNPVIVLPEGQGVRVVDALVVRA